MPLDYTSTFNFSSREEAALVAWSGAVQGRSEVAGKLNVDHVEAMIDTAVDRTCDSVFAGDDYLKLQDELPVSIASGKVTLSRAVYAMSLSPDRGGSLIIAGIPANWLDDLQEVFEPKGVVGNFYTVQGNAGAPVIYAADGNGVGLTITGTALACVSFDFPLLLTTKSELKGIFISILIDMAQKKLTGMVPTNG